MTGLPFRPHISPWPQDFEVPNDAEKVRRQRSSTTDQWIAAVPRCSSEFGSDEDGWTANMIVGPPRVHHYQDSHLAWAPAGIGTAHEWVELELSQACHVQRVKIYESFTPGALWRICLWDGHQFVRVHEQEPRCGEYPLEMRCENVEIPSEQQIVTNLVRLDLDQTGGRSWYEIDAVQISGILDSPENRNVQNEEQPLEPLSLALTALLGDSTTSDCTLVVKTGENNTRNSTKSIPVHRGILAARCPLFRAMINRNELPLGGTKQLTGIASELVQLILEWIYTDRIGTKIDRFNCVSMTVASDYFQTTALTEHCVNVFCQQVLSHENAPLLYAHFDEICVDPLRDACLEYCGKHFRAVSGSKHFSSLSKEQLLTVIERHCKAAP